MKKIIFSLILLGGMSVNAQQLLEVLKPFNSCSSIPSNHPFHKVTRGNYKEDGTFADPYTGEGSAYILWHDAVNYNFPTGYHLPTVAEWRTIVPDNNVWNMGNNNTVLNTVENHQFGKKGQATTQYKTFKGDYYKSNDGTLYGIRFKPSDLTNGNFTPHTNTDYTTAYRYRNLSDRILVDINHIGGSNVKISDIANNDYWENATCKDAFVFLKKGYYQEWGQYMPGEAWFWTSDTGNNGGMWWTFMIGVYGGFQSNGSVSGYDDYMDTIRLFKD